MMFKKFIEEKQSQLALIAKNVEMDRIYYKKQESKNKN